MSEKYNLAIQGNEHYKKNIQRWVFLYHSYIGGDTYRRGEYLTKYTNESEADYEERLAVTPLDNHAAGVISVYNSFLFRTAPKRDWGRLTGSTAVEAFMQDADLEGRSLDAFMKDVFTFAAIFGHTWVLTVKPATNANTRADELSQGVRPYVSVITPLVVLDWRFRRGVNGVYSLKYLKYIESDSPEESVIKEWYDDRIITTMVDNKTKEVVEEILEVNGLNKIPATLVYSHRTHQRGIGISLINDISDLQRSIYNEYSEAEQNIRLSGHPSLVKTASTEAGAGPGALVILEDGMDPNLKPYLLQPTGASIGAIYESIKNKVEAIDRIANLGAIRDTTARTMSGVSREMEFEQLNARLSEFADNLEIAEEQIAGFFAEYEGTAFDGTIEYPESYNIRDANYDLDFYLKAAAAPVDSDTYHQEVAMCIVRTVLGPDALSAEVIQSEILEDEFEPHIMIDPVSGERTTATTREQHLSLAARGWIHLEDLAMDASDSEESEG